MSTRSSKRKRVSSEDAPPSKKSRRQVSSHPQINCQISFALPLPRKIEEITAPSDADWGRVWISATSTRNYMLRDPLLDWLKCHYSEFVTRNPKYIKPILNAVKDRRDPNSFIEYIMEQGNIFESLVIRLLTERFGDKVLSIGGEMNARGKHKVQETVDAMNLGVPIIHGGLLHNPENQTYGIPDLLIRSDWINSITKIHSIDRNNAKTAAPRLRDVNYPDRCPNYHYIVVDVKFTTLLLRADGVHILNSGSFKAYKSQLYIYNEALARIQGYNPQHAFILGRRWKFSVRGETFKGKSCLDRLGKIDYRGLDSSYIERTAKAIKWLRECRSDRARKWSITDMPLKRNELYPNMSNTHDHPWHKAKSVIANDIKELTGLWMVGVKHREVAHSRGVFRWTDERCTPEILDINGRFTSRILDKILEVNQPHRNQGHNVLPLKIKNNLEGWQTPKKIEFYVDFETVSDVLTEFEALPNVENTALIFMIGIGYEEPNSGRWNYRCFTVEDLTLSEEGKICQEFSDYVRSEAALYEVDNPLCVHWAHAEDVFWNDAMERHACVSGGWKSDRWTWFDLLKVFKEEPIVVKGALGFSLKQIAPALRNLNCISSTWDMGSSCLDGKGAMVGAWKACKEARTRNIPMSQMPQIREIIKYNEVDVKVLYEILSYLRSSHTK